MVTKLSSRTAAIGGVVVFVIVLIIVAAVIFNAPPGPELQKIIDELDAASIGMLDACTKPAIWDSVVENCKESAKQILDQCKEYPTMSVCSDPRFDLIINHPDDIVGRMESKNNLDKATLAVIDACSKPDLMNSLDCYNSMLQIQDTCNTQVYTPACEDERIELILSSGP